MKIATIPVGTTIWDRKGLRFLIADQENPDYDGTVLVSQKVICMRPFDLPKESYEDKKQKKYGSNNFTCSDLHQWLNMEDGFGQCISEELKKHILKSRVPCAGTEKEVSLFSTRIFIPSTAELGLEVPDHVQEGRELKLFQEFRNRYAMPSEEMVRNRPQGFNVLDENDTWCYWLRSSHPYQSCMQYISHSHSPYAFCEAFRDYVGVRVMFAVDHDMEITMDEKGGKI